MESVLLVSSIEGLRIRLSLIYLLDPVKVKRHQTPALWVYFWVKYGAHDSSDNGQAVQWDALLLRTLLICVCLRTRIFTSCDKQRKVLVVFDLGFCYIWAYPCNCFVFLPKLSILSSWVLAHYTAIEITALNWCDSLSLLRMKVVTDLKSNTIVWANLLLISCLLAC